MPALAFWLASTVALLMKVEVFSVGKWCEDGNLFWKEVVVVCNESGRGWN